MEIKIRKLTRKDRVTLTNLIKKFVNISGADSLVNMASSSVTPSGAEGEESAKDSTSEILETAFTLIEQMLEVIETDVTDWFCKLINVEKKDYDDLGFDVETEIIEQIISQKGFVDFFSRGSRVVKKIKALVNPSEN